MNKPHVLSAFIKVDAGVVGRLIGPLGVGVHNLIPWTCEYIPLYDKGNFVDVIQLRMLK